MMIVLREISNPYQVKMFILDDPSSGERIHKNKVERTLSEMRRLHDRLNQQLVSSPAERPTIHSPNDIFEVLKCFMMELDHEELWVVCLDTRNRVMSLNQIYKGSLNQSQVRVAELFKRAILDNACSIIIAHNHPSGDPSPSPDDVAVTRAVVEAGKLLDIEVLDHLVIGGRLYSPVVQIAFVSLKERGLGFN